MDRAKDEPIIQEWKSSLKSPLINEVVKVLKNRKGYSCKHCERQYDDDICDDCLAVLLVNRFQDSLIKSSTMLRQRAEESDTKKG